MVAKDSPSSNTVSPDTTTVNPKISKVSAEASIEETGPAAPLYAGGYSALSFGEDAP